MGKFMKKSKGMGGVIEVLRHGQLGVRTRARAQATEKIKELISSNCGYGKVGSSTSAKSFVPSQISYLELRSRRLAKFVGKTVGGCAGNKSPAARRSNSAGECTKFSDLTNSDVLAGDISSWLALSAEEFRGPCTQTYGGCDENREITHHYYGDDDKEEDLSLYGCAKSFQHWGNRGRAPPSVAQSRSNSRSNSVTRELPPPAQELRTSGILTRNRKKMETQFCETVITHANEVADMDAEVDLFCYASEHPASDSPHSYLARNVDVEVSFGEKTLDEGWFANERLTEGKTSVMHSREANTPSIAVRLLPELAVHRTEAASFNLALPLDTEIENFFQEAEHKEKRRFIKQYNFDPVTDTPLLGRYEWVGL